VRPVSKEARKLGRDFDETGSRGCESLSGAELRAREVEGGSDSAIQIEHRCRDPDQAGFELFVHLDPTLTPLANKPRGEIGETGRPLRAGWAELEVTQ
jgi:hypothetical protein